MGFLSGLFGKKDGPFEKYYESGQLERKGTFRDTRILHENDASV
jgi:antitoxin component YwqK of YwqJK toxin-antitoxin module